MSVFNCEKNNLDVPSEDTIKILHSKGTTIDYLSNEQIPEVINTITSITGKETLSKSLQMKGVVYNKAYIDFNKVLKVKSEDDIVNYTFNVYLENSPLNEFYNLIVTEDAQGVISKPYIIKYVLDSDAVEVYLANNRDFNYFKGKRHIMSFDDFFGNLDFNLGKSSVVLRCSEDEKPIDNTYSDDNDGDFYAIPSGNILQTNSGGYTYAQSQTPIAWHSHRLSLSTYNINTNQYFNSYAATVTNPVSTITAGGVQLTINTNISSQTISTAPSIISVQVTAYTTVTSSGGSSDGGPTGATFTGYTEITYKYSNGDTVVKIINTTSSKESEIKGVDCPEASQGIIGLSDDSIEENISHMLKLSRYNNPEALKWLLKSGHPGVSTFKLLPLYNFLAENTNENGVVSAEAITFAYYTFTILMSNPNANPFLGADCRSFEYAQPPGALQKGCAVKDFDHRFYTAGVRSNGSPYYGEIDINIDTIYFTMPPWMTNGRAANLTAAAVTGAIKAADLYFFNNPDITKFKLADIFKDILKAELAIVGGGLSTTTQPFPIPSPAPYITSVLGISNPFDCE